MEYTKTVKKINKIFLKINGGGEGGDLFLKILLHSFKNKRAFKEQDHAFKERDSAFKERNRAFNERDREKNVFH